MRDIGSLTSDKTQRKNENRNRIFRYLLEKRQVPLADIAKHLCISVPTVTQHVGALRELGLLGEDGLYESTGGRRAKAIACNPRSRVACGINITHNAVDVIVADLQGEVLDYVKEELLCEISGSYLERLQTLMAEMIHRNGLSPESIIGVGVSLPAIVDGDGNIRDTAFDAPLPPDFREQMQRYFPFPLRYVNDASSGGYAEFWRCTQSSNLFYLSLSGTVGGAARIHGRILEGDDFRSAEIGHTTMVPGGNLCYCGQRGCMNTYCSSNSLVTPTGGGLKAFFRLLEQGDPGCEEKWGEYLRYLAIAINNIRLMFDCDIILGGSVGRYIPKYIPALVELLSDRDSFHRPADYIRACKYHSESSAVGAALMFLDWFVDQV